MWPWEHLAFGYLLYSGLRRSIGVGPPGSDAALALFLATQLPDLVDKPLGWVLHVVPSGRSFGHSLLVGLPLVLVVGLLVSHTRHRAVGTAFALGYLSHLAGDVLYPLVTEGELELGFLLWPLLASPAGEPVEALPYLLELLGDYAGYLGTATGGLFLAFEVALLGLAFVVWLGDGAPGLRPVVAALGRAADGT